ncbi:MAG: hypothetical protein JWM12_349 [Ilumatobacteraceae bacterium]|nr:hypothetical protein [Ilumatobacteraceae bacterium]
MTGDLREHYRRDGVVVVRGALDPDALAELAAALDENLAEPGPWANDYTPPTGAGRFFGDYVNWQRIDGYGRIALTGALPKLAHGLIDGPVRFFHEHALVKEPGTNEITPWHHDEPYYCVDGAENVSLWVPLDPVPAPAGVRFVVGSHRWGRRFVPRMFADHTPYAAAEDGFELVSDIDRDSSEHEILSFDVAPGDVLAFHFRTVHSAPGTAGLTAWAPSSQLPLRRR